MREDNGRDVKNSRGNEICIQTFSGKLEWKNPLGRPDLDERQIPEYILEK
jgi:hypothetical protein